ncbi:MAG: DUF3999 family protein [Acidobacteriota bacterium]
MMCSTSRRRSVVRRGVLRVLVPILAWALSAAAAHAERGSQALAVDEDGWTAVRLDGEALAFSGVDLSLFDAGGEAVAHRLLPADADASRRTARIEAVDETTDGWLVTLSLGASPPRHTRLVFAVEKDTVAREVALEASDDGVTWRPLAVADLFRLGDRGGLQRLAIDYPPTEAGSLRLRWPRAAGLPVLEQLTVSTLGDERGALQLDAEALETVNGSSRMLELPAPAHLARRLDLELSDVRGPLGYRLSRAVEGRWRVLAEGSRAPGEDEASASTTLRLPIQLEEFGEPRTGGATLRLDLWGAELATATLRRAALDLVFTARADRSPYRLAWAFATPPPSARGGDAPAADVTPRRATAAAPVLGPWPPLPARLTAPGGDGPTDARRLGEVVLPGAAAEGLMSLRLDASALSDPSALTADRLRLTHQGRQVPFVARRLDRPSLVWSREAVPQTGLGEVSTDGLSAVELATFEAGADSEPWHGMFAVTARGPFARRVRLVFERPGRPGVDARLAVLDGWREWRCAAASPPCLLPLELDRVARRLAAEPGVLRLEIDDGDDAPLDKITLALWHAALELRFVWPGAAPELLVLDRPKAPVYDLETLLRGPVLAWPATPLRVAVEAEPTTAVANRWLPLALGVAALALLLVLGRLLRDATRER